MRAPADRALTQAPLLGAPTPTGPTVTPDHPTAAPATTATATPAPTNEHADAAYRDLLARVREEREQLGQLISHPF
ncbi:MAG TPA: hypothetical protein VMB27_25810 [Solirubrobacteraceae bacterium]|nr:hypothetical protein [Solirubrobacteraceae bacterium]